MNTGKIKIFTLILTFLFIFSSLGSEALAKRGKESASDKKKWVKSKDGLKSLIALSSGRGKMVKEYNTETKNYQRIKKAIMNGRVKKDEADSLIRKRYGDPVVSFTEEEGNVSRWVYKPGNVTFFDNEKVYLFFNNDGKLIDWKVLEGSGK